MLTMTHNGFTAKIQKAARLLDNSRVHGLPPGQPIDVYPVDMFKHPLPSWMGGPGNFVVPVQADWGLWFDWTGNNSWNTAVLPTIKGMNPITGQRTEGFGLERYQNKCPIHGVEFKHGNFCDQCNYKWAPQNYVAAPNTLWWDGFRSSDGKVRQFFFTEDMAKSIPELVLGKKDTIPAFGFAFYRTKVPRNLTVEGSRGSITNFVQDYGKPPGAYTFTTSGSVGLGNASPTSKLDEYLVKANLESMLKNYTEPDPCEGASWIKINDEFSSKSAFDDIQNMAYFCTSSTGVDPTAQSSIGPQLNSAKTAQALQTLADTLAKVQTLAQATAQCTPPEVETKSSGIIRSSPKKLERAVNVKRDVEVGVGAGAEIYQELKPDSLKLEDWDSEPSAVMRMFFVFEEQFKEIYAKGVKDIVGEKEGFLAGLPVG